MTLYSSLDMLALVAELNVRRIPLVMGARMRKKGGVLALTPREQLLLKAARRMHDKYAGGDYTHEERDERLVKSCCDFLVEQHAQNIGQTPRHDYAWDAAAWLRVQKPVADGSYELAMRAVRQM